MASRMSKRADGRYTLKVTTPDGARYVYGRTQAETRAKAKAMRDRLAAGAPVRDSTRTLGEWLEEWQASLLVTSRRAASTQAMHKGNVRTWLVPTLGTIPLDKIRPQDAAKLLLTMEQAGRGDSSRRRCLDTLRAALDDAVTVGLIATNPARKVPAPVERRPEARHLSPEEAGKLVAAAAPSRYAVVLKLILSTGLRRGEALALRWADVDLDRGTATVRGALVRSEGSLRVVAPKTATSARTVALSGSAVALLAAHRAAQAKEKLRAGNIYEDGGLVFSTELGKPVEPQNLLRLVRSAGKRAGLASVTVHTLRHTYATAALLGGVPLKVVSSNLGHASIQITADTYGHVTDDAARAAAELVSAAFGF